MQNNEINQSIFITPNKAAVEQAMEYFFSHFVRVSCSETSDHTVVQKMLMFDFYKN